MKRFFFVFKESYSAVHKKVHVQVIVFNKKAVVKISRIFNSKRLPWNLVKFRNELFLVNVSKMVCWIFSVLIMILLKRTLAHLLDLFKTLHVFIKRNSVLQIEPSDKGTHVNECTMLKNVLSVRIRHMNKVYLMGYKK